MSEHRVHFIGGPLHAEIRSMSDREMALIYPVADFFNPRLGRFCDLSECMDGAVNYFTANYGLKRLSDGSLRYVILNYSEWVRWRKSKLGDSTKTFSEALAEAFPTEDRTAGHLEKRGYRVLMITGHLFRSIGDFDLLIGKIKAVLPSDATIVDWDGSLFRQNASWPFGYMADGINMVFSSKTWPEIEEGALIPRLELFLYHKAPLDGVPVRLETPVLDPRDSYELVIDKAKFSFEIPRDRETPDQCVIVVRPKE